MFNLTKQELIDGITNAEKNQSYFFAKGLIDKDNLPNWEDMLKAIYFMANQPLDEKLDSQISKPLESLIGRLIVSQGVYFNFMSTEEDNTLLFPKVKEVMSLLRDLGKDFQIQFYGPKISIGPHFIKPHQDRWHAGTIQCEGSVVWSLRHEDNVSKEHGIKEFDKEDKDTYTITVEPGDFLYFSQKMFHQIEIPEPRASLLFNAMGLSEVINN